MEKFIIELYDVDDGIWFEYSSLYNYDKALYIYKSLEKSLSSQNVRLIKILKIRRNKNV